MLLIAKLSESKLNDIIFEVMSENFESSTGQINKIHSEIREHGYIREISENQILFVNYAASVLFFEMYNRFESITKDLASAILAELEK